jgi:hypothetical protein
MRSLVHEVHAAAMSDGQVEAVYGTEVDGTLLEALGYVADDDLGGPARRSRSSIRRSSGNR